jgi:MATE family multidrug resistance protein
MRFHHIPRLLKLAGPMILSSSAITLMQIIDTIILSRHSSEAVAAIGPSGMAVILFQGILFTTSGYAGTFAAHHHGRGDARGVRSAAWLGIHTSLVAGVLALATAWPLAQLFQLAGHEPEVAQGERIYFLICMAGSFFPVVSSALAGWLSGIGRPIIVTGVTFVSLVVNAVLAWGLVLGEWGLPRSGIAGAAAATVGAQFVAALLYLFIFARSGGLADAAARRLDYAEFRRYLVLAVPLGLRVGIEVAAWTVFLLVLGRLGTAELAASSIAFRINGTAFFPALGLGQAAGVLVGHARGAGRDDEVPSIGWQSLLVCEVWMAAMALPFFLAGEPLMSLFAGNGPDSARIVVIGTLLLKFVAFYCLFDAANVVIGCVLASAGDTLWLARTFLLCSGAFLVLLFLTAALRPGIVAEWTLATLFVFATALIWYLRFRTGGWRNISVLKQAT